MKKLQIADFALDCLKISFKSKISLQITTIAQPETLLWGLVISCNLPYSEEGVLVTRTPSPPYFELVEEKMNQLFTITRAYLWESHAPIEMMFLYSSHFKNRDD